jgi:hypothetical protein
VLQLFTNQQIAPGVTFGVQIYLQYIHNTTNSTATNQNLGKRYALEWIGQKLLIDGLVATMDLDPTPGDYTVNQTITDQYPFPKKEYLHNSDTHCKLESQLHQLQPLALLVLQVNQTMDGDLDRQCLLLQHMDLQH